MRWADKDELHHSDRRRREPLPDKARRDRCKEVIKLWPVAAKVT